MKAFITFFGAMFICFTALAETAVCTLNHVQNGGTGAKILEFNIEKKKFTGDNIIGSTRFYQNFESQTVALEGVNDEQNNSSYHPKGPFKVKMLGQFSTNLQTNTTAQKLEIRQVWNGYNYFSGILASANIPSTSQSFSFSSGGIKKIDPMASSDSLTASCQIVGE